jgi:PAS domain S-box-containing protein
VTDRRRAEQALAESENRYRAVVENLEEMLCRFQADGTILFVNPAYARARGAAVESLVGQNFWSFIAEHDRPAVRELLERM